MSNSLRPPGLQPASLLCPWDFPGKNTGVGYHFPLQGIFPTQGLNLGLLHCRQTLYRLSHQGGLAIKVLSVSLRGGKKHIFDTVSNMQDSVCHRYSEGAGDCGLELQSLTFFGTRVSFVDLGKTVFL